MTDKHHEAAAEKALAVGQHEDLMHPTEVCRFFGDINRVTLWRHVRAGRISAPVKISARMNRWLRSEVEADRARMIAARGAA